MKKLLKRLGIGLLGLIVAVVLTGAIYEQIGRRSAAHDFPTTGALVDIGGRRINLDCRGSGTPTVVLVHGLDTGGIMSWTAVQDSIAATTRTCAYSRAGIMHSDPSPGPVTAKGVAEDLHAALEKAGEKPPFVMVGHSLGGPYIMTYTKYFGPQVAGLVMVDASHPDQIKRMWSVAPSLSDNAFTPMKIASALSWTGLVRGLTRNQKGMPNQSDLSVKSEAAYTSTSLGGALKEAEALSATLDEAGTFRTLGDRPLVVLTATKPMAEADRKTAKLTEEQATKMREVWTKLHDEEATWSTRSTHTLVPDATHYIQFFRPDVVIAAVRSVVDTVRAGSPAVASR